MAPRIRCVVFGNMCAGKTTVAQVLKRADGTRIVSAKDAIAANLATASDEVRERRKRGYLLPDELITAWIFAAIRTSDDPVVLDGFPRTATQATALLDKIGAPGAIVYLDFSPDILRRRLASRILCARCEMPGSSQFGDYDGSCASCGGRELEPRPTDRPDYMEVKMKQFAEVSTQVLPVFRAAGLRFAGLRDHDHFAGLVAEASALREVIDGN